MSTISEFVKTGITGHTFREIREKFGQPLDRIGDEDKVMSMYAIGFAWYRRKEGLPIEEAYATAMSMDVGAIEALFESEDEAGAAADFESQPSTTTP